MNIDYQYDVRPRFESAADFFNAAHYDRRGRAPVKIFGRKEFYKIWLVYNPCKLHLADQHIHIQNPALIFSNPHIAYGYEGIGEHRSGYWCIFKEEFLRVHDRVRSVADSPLFKIQSANIFYPDEKQLSACVYLFEQLIMTLHSTYVNKYDELKNYINLLVHAGLKAKPMSPDPLLNGPHRLVQHFLKLLETQFPLSGPADASQLRTPGDFSQALGVHVNHLNHSVKTITGKTTQTHINEKVIAAAKGLLKHTDWDIAEIAYAMGFNYPNYFNTFFKKHTGMQPKIFRDMI